jgi:hypothetical protein
MKLELNQRNEGLNVVRVSQKCYQLNLRTSSLLSESSNSFHSRITRQSKLHEASQAVANYQLLDQGVLSGLIQPAAICSPTDPRSTVKTTNMCSWTEIEPAVGIKLSTPTNQDSSWVDRSHFHQDKLVSSSIRGKKGLPKIRRMKACSICHNQVSWW